MTRGCGGGEGSGKSMLLFFIGLLQSIPILLSAIAYKIRSLLEFLVAQRVKKPALSLLKLRSLLWHRSNTWPGNFHMLWEKKEKKKRF